MSFLSGAQTEIDRVAKDAVEGPLGKLHVNTELRPDPVDSLVRARVVGERRSARFQRLEHLRQALEIGLSKAGTHLSRIRERRAPTAERLTPVDVSGTRRRDTSGAPRNSSSVIEKPDHQRAEMVPRLPRLRPPADHEILGLDELEFLPGRAARATLVTSVWVFGYKPFPSLNQCTLPRPQAVTLDTVDQPERSRVCATETALQPRAAIQERQRAEILMTIPQQVKRDEGNRNLARGVSSLRVATVKATLEMLKPDGLGGVGVGVVQGDDFPVEQDRMREAPREPGKLVDEVQKLSGLVVAQPGPDANAVGHATWLHLDDRPDAIELGFEHESLLTEQPLLRAGVGQDGQHGSHVARVVPPARRLSARGGRVGRSGSGPRASRFPGGLAQRGLTRRHGPLAPFN